MYSSEPFTGKTLSFSSFSALAEVQFLLNYLFFYVKTSHTLELMIFQTNVLSIVLSLNFFLKKMSSSKT